MPSKERNGVDRGPSRTTWPPAWMPKEPQAAVAPVEKNRQEPAAAPAAQASESAVDVEPAPPITMATTWPAAAADFLLLLTADDLPEDPRAYGQECVQVDRQLYLTAMKRDIRKGPSGPRARYGALQDDILSLRKVLVAPQASEASQRSPRSPVGPPTDDELVAMRRTPQARR